MRRSQRSHLTLRKLPTATKTPYTQYLLHFALKEIAKEAQTVVPDQTKTGLILECVRFTRKISDDCSVQLVDAAIDQRRDAHHRKVSLCLPPTSRQAFACCWSHCEQHTSTPRQTSRRKSFLCWWF